MSDGLLGALVFTGVIGIVWMIQEIIDRKMKK